MASIAVVDYGMGNLRSVAKALEHVAPKTIVRIVSRPEEVLRADRVVLPGQGAMPDCMRFLAESGLREAVLEAAATKPLLGICVGEQMLFNHSEEGQTPGLGVLSGQVRRFKGPSFAGEDLAQLTDEQVPLLKVPHMGWNRVDQTIPHPLWNGIKNSSYFYFVHSYYVVPNDPSLTVGCTDYGVGFTCAVASQNIFATQFHPEKSAASGLKLFENFVSWQPN